MRFSSGLFLQQSVARGGAQLEGDGEVTLPPVLQPILFLPSPLSSLTVPADSGGDTFMKETNWSATGAQASVVSGFPLLTAGLWWVKITWSHTFSGTTNLAKQDFIDLVDSSGTSARLASLSHNGGLGLDPIVVSLDYWFSFRDANRIRITLDDTIAGDILVNRVNLYAMRML